MHRFSAALAPVAAALLASSVHASESEIRVPFDEAWRRAVTALAADYATVTLSDERTGIIQATWPLEFAHGKHCMKVGGRLERVDSKVTITLRPASPTVTLVSVKAAVQSSWYRFRKLVFIRTGRVYDYPTCPAPDIESTLLERIRH